MPDSAANVLPDAARPAEPPRPQVTPSELNRRFSALHEKVESLRDDAGRSPAGRHYSIVATDLEKILAFVVFHGL